MSQEKKSSSAVVVLTNPDDSVTQAVLGQAKASGTKEKDKEEGEETRATTRSGRVTIGEALVDYTVTADTLTLRKDGGEGDEQATLFYVAYTRDDVGAEEDPASRPITFCFNGGPGSSSVWLHLGAFGPRRVRMDGDRFVRPPFELVDNAASLLDVTDLVFIDPVSTGFSRPAKGVDQKDFHSVQADVESVAEFIRLYTTRNTRWASPKFLAGESYGTTRASALAEHLQSRHGLFPNGLILLSCALQFQTLRFDPGNELPFVLLLPSMAATAFYHGVISHPEGLRGLLAEAEAFAHEVYAPALFKGDRLSAERRAEVARGLARLTGLSAAFVERCRLRPSLHRFAKELLRERGETVGRLDSRFTGVDRDDAGETYDFDPSYVVVLGPFTAALNDLLRREIGYENDAVYEILTHKVWPWKFEQDRYLDVTDKLRDAMNHDPFLRVFVANGYYDLATPYFASDYSMAHLGLGPERLATRVESTYYEAGHMMYLHEPSLTRLKADIAGFIARSLGRAPD